MKKKKSKKFLFIRGSILLIVGLVSLIFVIYFTFIKKDDDPFKDSKKYWFGLRRWTRASAWVLFFYISHFLQAAL